MELPEEHESQTKCYKFNHHVFDNLNIIYNSTSSLVVLWNKFQIFVYEDMNFERVWKTFVPEFQVQQLIISCNYLVCLDTNGNIHTSSLKFKNPAQKRFKSSFQLREQHMIACTPIEDSILSIKYDCRIYFLSFNKINADFSLENKTAIKYNGRWPLPDPIQGKCIITSHKLSQEEMHSISNIFGVEDTVKFIDSYLVAMTFDKLNVYGCIYNPMCLSGDVALVKLYMCPSEICNIEIIKKDSLFILVGLNIGTVIRMLLNNLTKGSDLLHLNTALYKYLTMRDVLFYTDGKTMWKCEDTFTNDVTFTMFVVRHVKDFIRIGDKILCTTFTNMLYIFLTDDESCIIKPETTEEYCSAEILLNNSEYLYKIIEEVDKNSQITKRLREEGSYITAFSLSKRQDVMENLLLHTVTVYNNYEDVIRDNVDVTLTESTHEYFKPNMYYILLKLTATSLSYMFNNMLSNIYGDVKVHVTFSTDVKLLKTTSIKITKDFKKINLLLPCDIQDDDVSLIKVNIKLVSSIPGAFDERQKLWVTFYRKNVILNSEHMLKPNATASNNFISLKDPIEPLGDIIYKTVMLQYGNIVSITDVSKYHTKVMEHSLYAKLPNNYSDVFKDESKINCLSHLSKSNATFLLNHLKADEFLKSESYLYFRVGNAYVKLDILNDDFANPTLKVTSMNIAIAFHIRNFISEIVYNNYTDLGPNKEFIHYTTYNVVENLQKEIKQCLLTRQDYEEFQAFSEQFEKIIIGTLPL